MRGGFLEVIYIRFLIVQILVIAKMKNAIKGSKVLF